MNNIKELIDAVCARAVYMDNGEEVGRCGTSPIFPENSLSLLPITKSFAGGRVPRVSIGILLSPPIFNILLISDASWNSVLKSKVDLVQCVQRRNLWLSMDVKVEELKTSTLSSCWQWHLHSILQRHWCLSPAFSPGLQSHCCFGASSSASALSALLNRQPMPPASLLEKYYCNLSLCNYLLTHLSLSSLYRVR